MGVGELFVIRSVMCGDCELGKEWRQDKVSRACFRLERKPTGYQARLCPLEQSY